MFQGQFLECRYEPEDNIFFIWYIQKLILQDNETVRQHFQEVKELVSNCPTKPFLLVNYANFDFQPSVQASYLEHLKVIRSLVIGVYRFNVAGAKQGSLTAITVKAANIIGSAEPNIFPDEVSARQAIKEAKTKNHP